MFVRAATVSIVALFAVLQGSGEASADHRLRLKVLWPKIYAPHISGYLYRDEFDDEDDEGFFDPEDEDEYLARRRYGRNVVLDLDEDDFEPVYEPPRKKAVKAKPKAKSAEAKKLVKRPEQATATVVKPKVKPAVKTAALVPAPAIVASKPVTVKAPVSTAAIKAEPPLASAAIKPVVPQTVAPKTVPVKAVISAGTIGCSKGAEIVSGYGFTSVKPRVCSGTTYSFDAARSANAYLIKVAAATGEITDVQKLK